MRLPAPPLRHPNDSEILRLAVPAFGALVAEPLFLLADAAIVGHLGTPELAGLGVAATVIASGVSLCIFLAYGTTSVVARMIGAGDFAGALRRGVHGLWLALSIGVLLATLGLAGAPTMVGWFGPDAEAAGHAVTYMRISMGGIPAILIVLAMTGVLRGLQDTRTPLFVAAAANLANIGLSVGLVYGVGLGIGGSALGTVIAQWSAAAVYVLVVVRSAKRLNVRLNPDLGGMRAGLMASAPLLVRNVALRGVLVLSTVVVARQGPESLAAHQVAFTIWTTLSLSLDAVAIAGQALVGRYLGASDVNGARAATNRMVEWSIGAGVVFAAILIAAHGVIPSLFSPDPEVQRLLASALIVVAVMQPVAGWVFALDGVLIGAGDARYIAVAQVLTLVVFAPLAMTVLIFDLGLNALWWALGGWTIARLIVMAWRERGDAWLITGPGS